MLLGRSGANPETESIIAERHSLRIPGKDTSEL